MTSQVNIFHSSMFLVQKPAFHRARFPVELQWGISNKRRNFVLKDGIFLIELLTQSAEGLFSHHTNSGMYVCTKRVRFFPHEFIQIKSDVKGERIVALHYIINFPHNLRRRIICQKKKYKKNAYLKNVYRPILNLYGSCNYSIYEVS